jgi:hypothetical protein
MWTADSDERGVLVVVETQGSAACADTPIEANKRAARGDIVKRRRKFITFLQFSDLFYKNYVIR